MPRARLVSGAYTPRTVADPLHYLPHARRFLRWRGRCTAHELACELDSTAAEALAVLAHLEARGEVRWTRRQPSAEDVYEVTR